MSGSVRVINVDKAWEREVEINESLGVGSALLFAGVDMQRVAAGKLVFRVFDGERYATPSSLLMPLVDGDIIRVESEAFSHE